MPLVFDNHIQIYVHSKDHYNIDDGDVEGFCEEAVHKDRLKYVLAECLLKVLTNLTKEE